MNAFRVWARPLGYITEVRVDGIKNAKWLLDRLGHSFVFKTSEPINEARATAESTMLAIMGRISAYTGKETTWQEMMDSDMRIGPETYAMGSVDMEAVIPVPGEGKA